MEASCSEVTSVTVFAVSVMTAIPSIATMFSTAPVLFSSSDSAREAFPMSTLPAASDSSPALEPVNSAVTLTPGFFSMNASANAFASFSMEVLPAMVTDPVSSAVPSSVSASPLSVVLSAWLSAAGVESVLSAVSLPQPITPAAIIDAVVSNAIIFTSFFFIMCSSPLN